MYLQYSSRVLGQKRDRTSALPRSLLGVKLGRLLDGYSVDRASPRSLRDYVME